MKSLAERLKTKAMMIAMGEKIAFGSDSELMLEAAKEIERLEAELAAIRNQEPIGYLEKHLIESGRKIQLCNLTKTRLWSDSVPIYLAAGAHPVQQEQEGPLVDGWQITLSDGHTGYGVYAHMTEYPDEGAIFLLSAGAQPVPEGMAIVPIEISEAMYEAYHKADNAAWCQMGASHGASIGDIWDAMLAAAKETK